ncbi:site-specific integrase [Marinilactibacillus kalidii]|uniref:site-specific integrase n=1 Tax=Marinilactibacillus kalidii TaxID=2820274 RepID=UPI001ABE1CDA|nr:site-specific integrase [Marinilactibacillus kalidii]
MSRNGSLKYQLIQILKQQHTAGYGHSRHIEKLKHGRAATEKKIYASKSFEKHKSAIIQFHDFLKEKGVKKITEISQDEVKEYVEQRVGEGKSHKTIQSDLTALNKVLGEVGHEVYTAKKMNLEGVKMRQNNRLDKEREQIPDKYAEQVELAKMAGLRRTGIAGINTNSFYRFRDKIRMGASDQYFILVVEKGGKPRLCEVNEKYVPEFNERYKNYIHFVDKKSDIPNGKSEVKEALNAGAELYQEKVPSKYALHIYRAEYAKDRFEQLQQTKNYKAVGILEDHNGFKADRSLFLDLARNLGHNRTDVISKYLRLE